MEERLVFLLSTPPSNGLPMPIELLLLILLSHSCKKLARSLRQAAQDSKACGRIAEDAIFDL